VAVVFAATLAMAVLGQPSAFATQGSGPVGSPPAPVDPSVSAQQPDDETGSTHAVPNPLLKEQFATEEDDDNGDDPDVSALCQAYLGHPSPYRPLAPNVNTISADPTVPTGSQAGCHTAQNETTVAVNPHNPRNIVAGSNDYRLFNTRESRNDASGFAYTSFDGGRTWSDVELPALNFQSGATAPLSYMDSAGDPAIAFGPLNTVYYATLVFSRATVPDDQQSASGIAVSVSHDGGLHWGAPAIVHLDGVTAAGKATPTSIFNDKEWIATDPVSGKVYVTWTQFTYDADGDYVDSPIVASASSNYGRTWSPLRQVSPPSTGFTGGITSFGSGSNPQVGDKGTLYVAYETSVCAALACDASTDHDAVVLAVSRDGGRTFRNAEVASDFDFPVDDDIANNALTGENFRINSFPQLAYDRLTDHLWVTWADDRDGRYTDGQSVRTDGDVFLAGSTGGGHWSKPARIGTGTDEVFPAVAASAGKVAVSFYTRGYDPHGIGLDYAYVGGRDATVARAPIVRITTQTADPQVQFPGVGAESGKTLQGTFIGDYTAMAIGSDLRIHPTWTDFRGKPGTTLPNQDVVTQSIPLKH
jgi:hypothetical protein